MEWPAGPVVEKGEKHLSFWESKQKEMMVESRASCGSGGREEEV